MKVSIALVAATLMIAAAQNSVFAGQTAKPGKTSGKSQAKPNSVPKPPNAAGKKTPAKPSPTRAGATPSVNPKAPLTIRGELIATGDNLPAYSVIRHSDGKQIELSSLVTEQDVIVLYHPGSKPAMRALPLIAAAAAKSKPGIKVYALCVRTDEAAWKASVKTLPTTMLALWDPAGRKDAGMNARKVLGCDAYPTLIVTGSDGKVRDAFAGWFSGDRRLAPLLSE
jgi:hypothetical protein